MAQRLCLLALLLVSLASFASEPCDSAVESVYTVARICLREKVLAHEDVEFMIAKPGEIQDPFLNKPRDPDNLSFRRKMEKHLTRVKPEHTELLHARLQELLDDGAKERALVDEAHEWTAPIFAPREMRLPNTDLSFVPGKPPFWHKGKNGELFYGVFNPINFTLKLFSVSGKSPPVEKSFADVPNFHRANLTEGGDFSTLSLPNGNLLVAYLYPNQENVLIHNFDTDQTFNVSPRWGASSITLIHDKEGTPFLLTTSDSLVALYRIEDSVITLVGSFSARWITEPKILNSPDGRLVVALIEDSTKVHVLDFFAKSVRSYKPTHGGRTRTLSAVLKPDGDYAVAFEVRSTLTFKSRFEFIVEKHPHALATEDIDEGYGALNVNVQGEAQFAVSFERGRAMTFDIKPPNTWWYRLKGLVGLKKQILKPKHKLDKFEGTPADQPHWVNLDNGRTLLVQLTRVNDISRIAVYDLEKSEEPIFAADFLDESTQRFAGIFHHRGTYYAQFLASHTSFYELRQDDEPAKVFHRPSFRAWSGLATDADGSQYMIGVPNGKALSIYRMIGREETQ